MKNGSGGGGGTGAQSHDTQDLAGSAASATSGTSKQKPPFRPAKDDTKPVLRDPILRSDPMETEQAVLLLPPFPRIKP